MSDGPDLEERERQAGHRGHSFWVMVACCAPMLVLLALIVFKVL